MQPADSQANLEKFIADADRTLATLAAADAMSVMLAFYGQVRAEGCPIEEDGDMVLFQWGAFGFGQKETYHYNFTRQFISSAQDEDDGEMSQLALTLHFALTDELSVLEAGNRWCDSPAQVAGLERFIRDHAVTAAVAALRPVRTTLEWGLV